METLLIASFLILFYTYIGYGLLMRLFSHIKGNTDSIPKMTDGQLPSVALLIPAFNEEDVIEDKVRNSILLDYPADKKSIYVVTDGSTDHTMELVKQFEGVKLLHSNKRRGKVGAVNRAMELINEEITVSTDANTLLNKRALKKLVRHFSNPGIAAVSGEKKIYTERIENANGAGEGLYWRYESTLKKLDSDMNTMVGAAGELIAYRTNCFEKIPENTIIEDFYMTMRFADQGYKVAYEPHAFALEKPSASVKEEMKRKVRICAGGFQAIKRFKHLLNPLNFNMLSFQYISHRVLRWTVAPLALVTLFVSSILLIEESQMYSQLAFLQVTFYLMAGLGYLLKRNKLSVKALYVPYYFCMMNYAVIAGFFRYLKGQQSVTWEKALRRA